MKKDRSSNIFDEAAKKLDKKKKKKKIKTSSSAKPHPKAKAPAPEPKEAKVISGDLETSEMFKKIRDMEDDLENKMQNVCELSGMSKTEVFNFIENPENFTPEQWKKAQKDKDELEKKLFKSFGMKTKKKFLQKKKKKLTKGRRGKTLGSRKGWIQM